MRGTAYLPERRGPSQTDVTHYLLPLCSSYCCAFSPTLSRRTGRGSDARTQMWHHAPPSITNPRMAQLDKAKVLERMSTCGVVAVIRAPSKDVLVDVARALLAGGVISIEVTMSTPDAIKGIEMLAKQFASEALIGVGTVLDAKTASDAISAGAQFVVSPAFDADVVKTVNRGNVICIPGAFTPTEILRAHHGGADVVKVFPSTALGPGY